MDEAPQVRRAEAEPADSATWLRDEEAGRLPFGFPALDHAECVPISVWRSGFAQVGRLSSWVCKTVG